MLQQHPEYNQCWFSQQAEWNLYSYQCAATIESLPFEYKLLWHSSNKAPEQATPAGAGQARAADSTLTVTLGPHLNTTSAVEIAQAQLKLAQARVEAAAAALDGPGRSNCNLPTICFQCRGGKDGEKRPAADLMARPPCGFCRCAADLGQPSLVTLPTATPTAEPMPPATEPPAAHAEPELPLARQAPRTEDADAEMEEETPPPAALDAVPAEVEQEEAGTTNGNASNLGTDI